MKITFWVSFSCIVIMLFLVLRMIWIRYRLPKMKKQESPRPDQDNDTQTQQTNTTFTMKNKKQEEFLEMLNETIKSHILDTRLNSNTLAPMMYISPSSLAKKVKEITGMNARAYVLLFRLEKAKKLLKQSDLPMNDVQVQCGFETQSHFCHAFSKHVGMTPTKYRKIIREKG